MAVAASQLRGGVDYPRTRLELDESYVGGVEAGVRGRETIKKAIVAIAAEVDGRKIGRIRLRWVPDLSAPVLRGFVKDSIVPASTVHTRVNSAPDG